MSKLVVTSLYEIMHFIHYYINFIHYYMNFIHYYMNFIHYYMNFIHYYLLTHMNMITAAMSKLVTSLPDAFRICLGLASSY